MRGEWVLMSWGTCVLCIHIINHVAAPLENNTLEWHYVIEGVEGTPYEHGWYHGEYNACVCVVLWCLYVHVFVL